MNKRSFEILAKYIGKTHKVQVEFSKDVTCPQANPKEKHIRLPDTILADNAYAGLATIFHEAGHVRYTKPADEIVDTELEFNILNAIEDVRIDRKNFDKLPNIHAMYKYLMDKVREKRKGIDMSKVPLGNKVLSNAITELEGFDEYSIKEKEVRDFERKHNVKELVWQGVCALDSYDYKQVKKVISSIMQALGWHKLPQIPLPKGGQGTEGKGKGKKEGNGQARQGKDKGEGEGNASGSPYNEGNSLMDPGDLFGNKQGKGHTYTVTNTTIGKIGLQEQTRKRFKELLNIKETRIIEDGCNLDTDNLTAYLTGDMDELFNEEKIVHKKKSKLVIVMDSSGSMGTNLFCGKTRKKVVAGCVQEITSILDELANLEGINVDYTIAAFDDGYYPLKKDNWQTQYLSHNGGTDLLNAFIHAQDSLLKEQDVDGNRMIVLMTDGEVSTYEIEEMKKRILRHNADVRCMIIGVGATLLGTFVNDIIGDFNIISSELADEILMGAISTMLGG